MKKTTLSNSYFHFLFTLLLVLGLSVRSFGQCPTITNFNQSFCDAENATIAELVATDNGNGIRWYATPTSTTPLPNSLELSSGFYYADNNLGNCVNRPGVEVKIYGPPTATSFQGVCVNQQSEAIVSQLVAIGNDVRWYTSENGGSPLAPTTQLVHNKLYYVDQANPDSGCRTSRLEVKVTIGVVPIPTVSSIQEFCADTQPTVADLAATGNNNWYLSPTARTPLDPSTLLVNGLSYYATTIDPPCESGKSVKVTVVLNRPNNAGEYGEFMICEATTGTINLFDGLLGNPDKNGVWSGPATSTGGYLGTVDISKLSPKGSPFVFSYAVSSTGCPTKTTDVWVFITEKADPGLDTNLTFCRNDAPQKLFNLLKGTPEPGGVWSPALAGGIFDPKKDAAGTYTYTVQGVPPCGSASSEIKITVNPEAQPGTNGSLIICENGAPQNLFNQLGGSPQSGGTWSPALSSGNAFFDPTKDSAGTYTYTVAGLTPCGDASASVVVTINALPNVGTDGSLILCSTDNPKDLFKNLGGNPLTGGTWFPALSSGSGIFNPAKDNPGVYTYTIQGTAPCGAASSKVNVTVNPTPQPGTNGNLILCEDSTPTDLFEQLGGSPQAGGTWSPSLASGTGMFDPSVDNEGIYTYTLKGTAPCGDASATVKVTIKALADAGIDGRITLCSNANPQDLFKILGGQPDAGGTWSPPLANGNGIFDPSKDAAGTYTYTVKGPDACGEATAKVQVSITPEAQPGVSAAITVCDDSAPQDLFLSLGSTAESGGTWSPTLASGTGVFDPLKDAAGVYTYTVTGTNPCGNASAKITVTVASEPNAGSGGRVVFCSNDAAQDLFQYLGTGAESGGTWSPAMKSKSGIYDPSVDPAGTYTYTITTPCGTDSATVIVALIPSPDATGLLLNTANICLEDDGEVRFSGANLLTDGNYNLIYTLSGANTTQQTVSIQITNGSGTVTIPAALLSNEGTTTFKITNLVSPITLCGTLSYGLPTVQFDVEQAKTPELVKDGDSFCEADQPTVADLKNNLSGANVIIWSDALENGNIYPQDTPLIDGTTYYALNTTSIGCTNGIPLAVTVSIIPCDLVIPDGFSPNGDNINDTFEIKYLKRLYPNFKLQIYNRYGNILYIGDKNTPNWDGTANQGRQMGSSVLPVGVYYYILELNEPNTKPIQGRVYLNR